ncbi:hypothetical protein ACFQ0M_08280 [Kitasatospora aburaviensis]
MHGVAQHLLTTLQGWLGDDRLRDTRLVVLTRGAVKTGSTDSLTDLVHAPLWGLARSAQSENPQRLTLLDVGADPAVDTDTDTAVTLSGAVLAAVLGADEPQFALRGGRLSVARLQQVAAADGDREAPGFAAGGRFSSREVPVCSARIWRVTSSGAMGSATCCSPVGADRRPRGRRRCRTS